MIIKELKLINFRNYKNLKVSFNKNINIFLGDNAQGKTNLLEAIYFIALTKSHRTNKNINLLNSESKEAKVIGIIYKQDRKIPLEIYFDKKIKKTKVNYIDQNKLTNYIGNLNVIIFSPEDLSLIKGSPANRRNFIDKEFSQINTKYLFTLSEYQKILKQRNNYLKKINSNKDSDNLYLEVLTEQLVNLGSSIIIKRIYFINKLSLSLNEKYKQLSGHDNITKIKYSSSLKIKKDINKNEIIEQLNELFIKNKKKEILLGSTLFGPHRDDLEFYINNIDISKFGSQGQQRTMVLALKLAEINFMKEETHESPILLLDDVLSELDSKRQTNLLRELKGEVQTFITTPSLNDVTKNLLKEPKIFIIEKGNITKQYN